MTTRYQTGETTNATHLCALKMKRTIHANVNFTRWRALIVNPSQTKLAIPPIYITWFLYDSGFRSSCCSQSFQLLAQFFFFLTKTCYVFESSIRIHSCVGRFHIFQLQLCCTVTHRTATAVVASGSSLSVIRTHHGCRAHWFVNRSFLFCSVLGNW